MNFSTSLFVLACVCAMVAANGDGHAKHHARKAALAHHQERSISKADSDSISVASVKSAINEGADGLSRAIDVVSPLAREAFSLGSDLASRVLNGGSESKEGRAFDANLLARVDSLISESSRAYSSLTNSKLAASVAQKASAVASLAHAAKAAASAAVAGH